LCIAFQADRPGHINAFPAPFPLSGFFYVVLLFSGQLPFSRLVSACVFRFLGRSGVRPQGFPTLLSFFREFWKSTSLDLPPDGGFFCSDGYLEYKGDCILLNLFHPLRFCFFGPLAPRDYRAIILDCEGNMKIVSRSVFFHSFLVFRLCLGLFSVRVMGSPFPLFMIFNRGKRDPLPRVFFPPPEVSVFQRVRYDF